MQGINVEAAVGRKLEPVKAEEGEEGKAPDDEQGAGEGRSTPKREADDASGGDEKRLKDEKAGEDSDTEIPDADAGGKTEGEAAGGEKEEESEVAGDGADAAKTDAA